MCVKELPKSKGDACDCVQITAAIAAPLISDIREIAMHIAFNSEACSWKRKLIKNKDALYIKAIRLEQRVLVHFLIAENEHNANICWRMMAVSGRHYLS